MLKLEGESTAIYMWLQSIFLHVGINFLISLNIVVALSSFSRLFEHLV